MFHRQGLFTMHAFFKVLHIFASTASLWISFTPPNLPPEKDEKAKSIALEVLFKQRFGRFMIKVSY